MQTCVSVSECVSFDFFRFVFSLPYLLLLLMPHYILMREENGCVFECVGK